PLEVMTFLNQLYSRFDALLDIYKVYKVETIGDCFMVAGGLVAQDEEGWRTTITHDRLHACASVCLSVRLSVRVSVRLSVSQVGIHSGPVMSGVVGSRMPRFCLFGDTVNTASRMES
ncbi:guanylyl and adenylyl cyclase family member, partial [Volvox carteri f. nagariensis]